MIVCILRRFVALGRYQHSAAAAAAGNPASELSLHRASENREVSAGGAPLIGCTYGPRKRLRDKDATAELKHARSMRCEAMDGMQTSARLRRQCLLWLTRNTLQQPTNQSNPSGRHYMTR